MRPAPEVPAVLDAVRRNGYGIREGALSPTGDARLRAALDPILDETSTGRNPFEGFHTKRISSPLAKTRALDDLILSPWLEQLADGLRRSALVVRCPGAPSHH